jgi:hypothetical protein
VRAFAPLGYDCRGEVRHLHAARHGQNLTVELDLDVGTWSNAITASFHVQVLAAGVAMNALLFLPVAKGAMARGRYPIGDAERWRKIVRIWRRCRWNWTRPSFRRRSRRRSGAAVVQAGIQNRLTARRIGERSGRIALKIHLRVSGEGTDTQRMIDVTWASIGCKTLSNAGGQRPWPLDRRSTPQRISTGRQKQPTKVVITKHEEHVISAEGAKLVVRTEGEFGDKVAIASFSESNFGIFASSRSGTGPCSPAAPNRRLISDSNVAISGDCNVSGKHKIGGDLHTEGSHFVAATSRWRVQTMPRISTLGILSRTWHGHGPRRCGRPQNKHTRNTDRRVAGVLSGRGAGSRRRSFLDRQETRPPGAGRSR